jgi:hypothetical protein
MKKILACLLLFQAGFIAFSQETQEYQAVFRDISGTVEVKAPGEDNWRSARIGQSISRTTLVSTGFKSAAILAVGNSLLTVRPLTRLTVEEMQETEGRERVNINLQTGRIRADVKPPEGGISEFTIRSPTATASVRGTSFEFDGLQLRVDEGRVHVTGGDRTGAYVSIGQTVSTDIETGWVTSAAVAAREQLVPPLPVGMESVPEVPATPSAVGVLSARFSW